eukprot:161104-Chlamydomonas_euryale.AAC.2
MTRSAHELVWGYEDPFLVRLSGLLPRGSVRQTRIELLHNASSPEEVLREEPLVVYHTGEYNLTQTWEVGGVQHVDTRADAGGGGGW